MMKKIFILVILLTAVFYSKELVAQPPDPGGGGTPNCFPPPCVPIDGGLSWLVIAGTVYGGKKVYDFSKKDESIVD